MKYFGTFNEMTSEEDQIVNRLAVIHRRREMLDYDKNEEWQEIKLLQNKQKDDKFKLKMWLSFALLSGFLGILWMLIPTPPDWVNPMVAYVVGVIATLLMLIGNAVLVPMSVICFLVFLVWCVLNFLRNGESDRALKYAELCGVSNRNALEAEHLAKIKELSEQLGALTLEEEKLNVRLLELKGEKNLKEGNPEVKKQGDVDMKPSENWWF